MTVIDLLEQSLQRIREIGEGHVHLSPDVTEIIINDLKQFEVLKQKNIVLCKDCKRGYQDEASIALGTVLCGKMNCFRLENWYCADGVHRE